MNSFGEGTKFLATRYNLGSLLVLYTGMLDLEIIFLTFFRVHSVAPWSWVLCHLFSLAAESPPADEQL